MLELHPAKLHMKPTLRIINLDITLLHRYIPNVLSVTEEAKGEESAKVALKKALTPEENSKIE